MRPRKWASDYSTEWVLSTLAVATGTAALVFERVFFADTSLFLMGLVFVAFGGLGACNSLSELISREQDREDSERS
jgi:hypothetical protein